MNLNSTRPPGRLIRKAHSTVDYSRYATHDAGSLAQIVAFLVAIMVLARACADEGLFESLGKKVDLLARGCWL